MKALPLLDLAAVRVPATFTVAAAEYCFARRDRTAALGVAVPFETEEGQEALAGLIATYWPELGDLAGLVREMVDLDPGCVVLRNLGYDRFPQELRDTLVLALTQTVGRPTDHNADKRVMWPIRPRDEEAKRPVDYKTTFSEEAGEAPLHTDSAFAAVPEKYNCLYVVKKAEDGGGLSVLLNVPRLVKELEQTLDGRECLDILRAREFPFRVPDAFFKGERLISAPVLGMGDQPFVRFRHDCLMAGFALREDLRTNDRLWAIEHFRAAAESSEARLTYMLQEDEAIVMNNHTILHARTSFTDRERHLIRVRMREAA